MILELNPWPELPGVGQRGAGFSPVQLALDVEAVMVEKV
jgi:hypothetical protein